MCSKQCIYRFTFKRFSAWRQRAFWCIQLNFDWFSIVIKNCAFQMKIWSSHLLDNLSNCLMNLKNSGDSTGFEPMTFAMPMQCSNQLSYEVTLWRAGQFVGFMFSRERNVIWKECYMQCGVWNKMKIWSSHLLDNLSNCLMNSLSSRKGNNSNKLLDLPKAGVNIVSWNICHISNKLDSMEILIYSDFKKLSLILIL